MYSVEYAVSPSRKREINIPIHFKPPDLLEVSNTVESANQGDNTGFTPRLY